MKISKKVYRVPQTVSIKARAARNNFIKSYCCLYNDARRPAPDCSTCNLSNYERDCKNNFVGFRDFEANKRASEVRERLFYLGGNTKK